MSVSCGGDGDGDETLDWIEVALGMLTEGFEGCEAEKRDGDDVVSCRTLLKW